MGIDTIYDLLKPYLGYGLVAIIVSVVTFLFSNKKDKNVVVVENKDAVNNITNAAINGANVLSNKSDNLKNNANVVNQKADKILETIKPIEEPIVKTVDFNTNIEGIDNEFKKDGL